MWRLSSYLTGNSDFAEFLHKTWLDYAATNAQHGSTPILYWEADKAFIRGNTMSYTVAYKIKIHQTHN